MNRAHAKSKGIGGFFRTINREYKESREYYLDSDRKDRLQAMHPLKRIFATAWWLFKSLYRRLTPARRVMLLVAIIIASLNFSIVYDNGDVTFIGHNTAL